MKGTVSISISRILEIIMAHAAAGELDGIRPCAIGRENKALVAVLADEELTALSAELPGIITDIEDDGDMRILTIETRDTLPLRAWRRNIETAVCCGILAHLWADGIGAVYAADREALTASMRSSGSIPGNITRA